MYSFGNRSDMSIVDEPFYAYYLHSHPEIDHPGKAETLASQSIDIKEIMTEVIEGHYPTDHVFFKNMAHHMDGLDWSYIKGHKNLFLIRNPRQLIASFSQVIANPTMLDIGLELEWKIFEYCQSIGADCIVLDSNRILENPEDVLTRLCDKLEIPFSTEMLAWEAGPRAADGVWAKYWYGNVHQSIGFKKQQTSARPFPPRLQPLLDSAQKYYEKLLAYSL